MDSATYIAFVAGLAVGLLAVAIVSLLSSRRARAGYEARLGHYEDELAELRQERADDRETNRRLRRELALNTPGTLEATRAERDRAIEELDKLHTELRQASSELAARDRSLREARLAIHDIRVQLERNRFELDDVTAEAAAAEAAVEAGIEASDDGNGPLDGAIAGADAPHEGDGHGDGGDYELARARPEATADGADGSDGPRFFADYPLGGAATS